MTLIPFYLPVVNDITDKTRMDDRFDNNKSTGGKCCLYSRQHYRLKKLIAGSPCVNICDRCIELVEKHELDFRNLRLALGELA